MNQYTMKKLAIAGMLFAILTALVACDSAKTNEPQSERMTIIENSRYGAVLCDNKTGVMYFVYDDYQSGGVCVMVDQNGKPLVMGEDK